jgi:hypothetical protein
LKKFCKTKNASRLLVGRFCGFVRLPVVHKIKAAPIWIMQGCPLYLWAWIGEFFWHFSTNAVFHDAGRES